MYYIYYNKIIKHLKCILIKWFLGINDLRKYKKCRSIQVNVKIALSYINIPDYTHFLVWNFCYICLVQITGFFKVISNYL